MLLTIVFINIPKVIHFNSCRLLPTLPTKIVNQSEMRLDMVKLMTDVCLAIRS